jgi:choline dehydrogenase
MQNTEISLLLLLQTFKMKQVWLLAASISSALAGYPQQHFVPGNDFGIPGVDATYDYVVVGGGTAGLAIAYRLSEDGINTVAVIEAGGFYSVENGNVSVVPAYNQEYNRINPESQWDAPLVDWGFLTTPQAGAKGQVFHYGRGKMLGGCSAQNAMNYNRPTKGSLDAWADAVNDDSYRWDNFLPYFEKSIDYHNPDDQLRAANSSVPAYSSANGTIDPLEWVFQSPNTIVPGQVAGPLDVGFPNWAAPLSSWAQLAFREVGIADVHSLIEGELIGSQYSPLTLSPFDQTRSSSQTSFLNTAFLKSGFDKQTLSVYPHTLAKQILFNDRKVATGVLVHSGPSQAPNFMISARKEVIVSAGAFQSPQLLMVSGIGPSQTLAKHNIPVIADRPGVGQNMWDHVVLRIGRQVNVQTYGSLMDAAVAREAERAYALNATGILTNGQSDYLGWENVPDSLRSSFSNTAISDLSTFPSDWPEVGYEISSAPFGTPSFSTPEHPIDVGYIQPVLLTPFSRGNISISSADTSDPPLINPNWLTHPTDQAVAIAAFKRARELFATTTMRPILVGEELLPGAAVPEDASDEVIWAYIQQNLVFNWHASCTCKMGRWDDNMAVVDSHARVIGVFGVRVVDASAFPLLPPGHPQATVYALAEKIAADILRGR